MMETARANQTVSSEVHHALVAGIEASHDPTLVIVERGGAPVIEWANRAFTDLVLADVTQLQSSAAGQFISTDWAAALNPLRAQRVSVCVRSQAGSASDWAVISHPSGDHETRRWAWTFVDDDSFGDDGSLAERFRVLSERAPIGIFSSDVGLRFGYVNDWFADLVQLPAEHLLGMGWTAVVDPDDLETVMAGMQQALSGTPFEGPARLICAEGDEAWVMLRIVPNHAGVGPASFLGTIEDITDRRRVEELLRRQATHDPLTGLKNRSELLGDISTALAGGADAVSVIFIDLDDFKLVNDLMGHAAGDELLCTIGERLGDAVRSGDEVYRYAGDEFVVLLTDTSHEGDTERAALRIHQRLNEPVMLGGHPTEVGCSLGAARARAGVEAEALVADADAAMYEAKRRGKGEVVLFDPSMSEAHAAHSQMVTGARAAIEDRELTFVYEPLRTFADTAMGSVVGPIAVAAVPSVVGPNGSVLRGAHLWDVARDIERLHEVLTQCVTQVCGDLAAWRRANVAVPWGAVIRLNARDIAVPGFVDHVARSLVRSKLQGDDLTLSLSGLDATLPSGIVATVAQLRDLGVKVWVEWGSITVATLAVGELRPDGVIFDLADVEVPDPVTCWSLIEMLNSVGIGTAARGLGTPARVHQAMAIGLTFGSGDAVAQIASAAEILSASWSSTFLWEQS